MPNSRLVSGLPRRPDWKVPRGGDTTQISFRAVLAAGKGVVTVSEFSGKRPGEKVKKIAEVVLTQGGSRVLDDEMRKFGFESVILKMVPADPTLAKLPMIVNPSLVLGATVRIDKGPPPTSTVSFVNNSGNAIDAIIWRTENAGRPRLLGTAANKYGEELIGAQSSYEMVVRAEIVDRSGTKLHLDAVIYEDGTVEGDAAAADNFLRLKAGRKAALEKILSIFNADERISGQDPSVPRLIDSIEALTGEIPKIEGRPTTPEGFAFAGVVAEVLTSLRSINDKMQTNEPPQRGITDLRSFYRAWYERL
jgi:hypothetical protein